MIIQYLSASALVDMVSYQEDRGNQLWQTHAVGVANSAWTPFAPDVQSPFCQSVLYCGLVYIFKFFVELVVVLSSSFAQL